MATDKPKSPKRRIKARRTTGRSAGISQSAFAGYGHQEPATSQGKAEVKGDDKEALAATDDTAESSKDDVKGDGKKDSSA